MSADHILPSDCGCVSLGLQNKVQNIHAAFKASQILAPINLIPYSSSPCITPLPPHPQSLSHRTSHPPQNAPHHIHPASGPGPTLFCHLGCSSFGTSLLQGPAGGATRVRP